MPLAEQKCKPCREGEPPLSRKEARAMAVQTPDWTLKDNGIERTFKFQDFRESMRFVNGVAELAESEGHHPDIHVYYNNVRLELSTHKIGGLSKNDFILAAKIDRILVSPLYSPST